MRVRGVVVICPVCRVRPAGEGTCAPCRARAQRVRAVVIFAGMARLGRTLAVAGELGLRVTTYTAGVAYNADADPPTAAALRAALEAAADDAPGVGERHVFLGLRAVVALCAEVPDAAVLDGLAAVEAHARVARARIPCTCKLPGRGRGVDCRAATYRLRPASDEWCFCDCHAEADPCAV